MNECAISVSVIGKKKNPHTSLISISQLERGETTDESKRDECLVKRKKKHTAGL